MDETLQNFLNTIETRSREELEALNTLYAEQNRQLAEETEKAAAAEAEQFRLAEMSKIQNVGELVIQARRTENRAALLEYRRKCQRETEQSARQKIADFTRTKDYVRVMRERLSQAVESLQAGDAAIEIYLRSEDMPMASQLTKAKNITFRQGNFSLGGLIVSAPSVSRRADMTFDTALRLAADRFAEIADMQL